MKYADLNALLRADPKAEEYFNSLPRYVQEQISTRSQGINSIQRLKDCAETLTRGDD